MPSVVSAPVGTRVPALKEALLGRFDDHHAELLAMLLRQVDALSADIDDLTHRIDELIGKEALLTHPWVDQST